VHGVTDGVVAAIYVLVMATKQKSKHCEVQDDKDKWCFHDLMRQGKYCFPG
jgi:hypothetical protein